MSSYSTGSVNLEVGSATVKGNSTLFTTYISAGDAFKVNGEEAFYEVASVVTATQLTLSARYADSSSQTTIAENVASTTSATTYSFSLSETPIIAGYFVINASQRFTDSAGVLTGSEGGVGTVGYDDGAVTLDFGATSLSATANIAASYLRGDPKNAMAYQLIRDFTSNHLLPEQNLNDSDKSMTYTKAIRMIDADLSSTSNSYIRNLTATELSMSGVLTTQGLKLNVREVVTDYSMTATDNVLLVNASITIELLTASTSNKGYTCKILNLSGSSCVASCMGSDTIEGDGTITFNNQYDSMSCMVATTNLYIII